MHNIIETLIEQICKKNILQKRYLADSLRQLKNEELDYLEAYIHYWESRGIGVEGLAEAYCLTVSDTLIEQTFFKKNGTYRYTNYKQVQEFLSLNHGYMGKYMIGLALTTFLWQNHLKILRFFINEIQREVEGGNYLEIGPGHGLYFLEATRLTNCESFFGVDICEESADMTRDILSSGFWGDIPKTEIVQGDFLLWSTEQEQKFSAVVIGEVLEHVENPLVFLKKIKGLVANDSFIFLTTCANAPEIDHIYLYRSKNEIESHIQEAGMKIVRELILPYNDYTIEVCEKEKLPINFAYVLTV